MRILKTGERTGSRPKPPEAVARAAPALSTADHWSKSAQLLPGDRLFVTVIGKNLFRQLDASTEASEPHDFSVRELSALVFGAARVHRILPRVRDDLEPPLSVGQDGAERKVICVF